jgi:xanthine/uracil permease
MPKVFQMLLIGLDIVLALAAAYTLFPALMNAASTLPVVLAALFAAGVILAIYGD